MKNTIFIENEGHHLVESTCVRAVDCYEIVMYYNVSPQLCLCTCANALVLTAGLYLNDF